MSDKNSDVPDGKAKNDGHPDQGPMVTITVNGVQREIHRGHRPVSDIKVVGHVLATDVLEQLIDGKLVTLPDDGAVVLKGGEVFVSHPGDGAAS